LGEAGGLMGTKYIMKERSMKDNPQTNYVYDGKDECTVFGGWLK
jgi:hypothetical protein